MRRTNSLMSARSIMSTGTKSSRQKKADSSIPRSDRIHSRSVNIHPVLRNKQPKRAADSRIDVQQFIFAIARVIAKIHVDYAVVSGGFHEPLGGLLHNVILLADAKAGHAGVHGTLPEFSARKGNQALRVLVEVAVEHPHCVLAARDVFLNDQFASAWISEPVVQNKKVLPVADDPLSLVAALSELAVNGLDHYGKMQVSQA